MNNPQIFALTQSILAIVALVGGGLMIIARPDLASAVTGIIGLVIGFYFREASGAQQAERQVEAVKVATEAALSSPKEGNGHG